MGTTRAPGGHRPALLGAAGAALGAVLSVVGIWVAHELSASEGEPYGPAWDVDELELARVMDRLDPVRADLDEVPAPDNAVAEGPATVAGCSLDSGEVLQPAASRSWRFTGPALAEELAEPTPAGDAAARAVIGDLREAGWEVTVRSARDHAVLLERVEQAEKVSLTIQWSDAGILAAASTGPDRLCRPS